MKTLVINGSPRQLNAGTVTALVAELGIPAPLILVELNGLALTKSEWGRSELREGDRIEILRVSAGG